jgi:hypothetical protein
MQEWLDSGAGGCGVLVVLALLALTVLSSACVLVRLLG